MSNQVVRFKRAHSSRIACWCVLPTAIATANKRKLSDMSVQTNTDSESSQREHELSRDQQPGRAGFERRAAQRITIGKYPKKLRRFMVGVQRKTSSCSSSSSISMHSGGLSGRPRLIAGREVLSRKSSGGGASDKQVKQRHLSSANWWRQARLAQPSIQLLRLARNCRSTAGRAQINPSMSLDDEDYEDVEYKSEEDEFRSDEECQREDKDFIHFNDHLDKPRVKSSHYQHKNNHQSQADLSPTTGLDGKRLRVLRKIATILRPQLCFKADLDSHHDFRYAR